ncbi:dephospho-CoA kinase [Bifidobacterium leontopitheci]|uniref:Dephospho-CoA kinase n=1 Tax=Bifidobacterium leontopitheci TaxID=2650774 RepID=A0A6I1GEL5_9BIFI|nr:dephospho-CoA kinase [Bifidobacterium leontopitheci]KAB7790070.1 dephospho-CoA kinase [Bifidobacterium leontopitheci]
MMIRVGLTGGIAAGKSTVAAHMRQLGAVLIDYDAIARAITRPGGAALPAIEEAFGPDSLLPDGSLNRSWMADHVFGSHAEPGARERLDDIEHPLVYAEAERQDRQAYATHRAAADDAVVVIHDVPLLAEVIDTIPFRFDHIVTVEAPESVRIARMMDERGMSLEQAQGRIRHQPRAAARRAIADIVIDSTQSIEQMFDAVDRLYAQWTGRKG